jgi:hypothetical protein
MKAWEGVAAGRGRRGAGGGSRRRRVIKMADFVCF